MDNTKFLFGVAALLAAFSLDADAAKLNKWVDKDGVTHYGDVVPPEYAGSKQYQLEQGVVKEKQKPKPPTATKPGATTNTEDTPEQIEQKRRDQALLGTYTNEDEIDQALKRNLQQVDTRISTIQMRMKTAKEDLDGYQKEKDALDKAGKPVDRVLQGQLDQAAAKVAKLQGEQDKAQAESEAIKARFAADKQRYRELTKTAN